MVILAAGTGMTKYSATTRTMQPLPTDRPLGMRPPQHPFATQVPPMPSRAQLAAFLEGDRFTNAIIAVIIFNAILLGLETSPTVMSTAGSVILLLDRLCLGIFVVELVLKLYAFGPRFFRSGWNIFDFLIVAVSLAPTGEGLSVLRALRILRALRLISIVPSLRRVVDGFLRALPGMGSVFLLMALIFYVAAVMATKLFHAEFPDRFGDLAASALTLFQVMTLEGWADAVVRPVMETHPYAWVFFIAFILVTTFAVVNLLIGLVVNALEEAAEAEKADEKAAFEKAVLDRLAAIEQRLSTR
jgi:voltage-gated sodium channel